MEPKDRLDKIETEFLNLMDQAFSLLINPFTTKKDYLDNITKFEDVIVRWAELANEKEFKELYKDDFETFSEVLFMIDGLKEYYKNIKDGDERFTD